MTDDDEAVGYGRPPSAHRFKPGRSGNPSGRPRGALNKLAATLDRILARRLDAPDGSGGARQMSAQEASLRRLVDLAVSGAPDAIERVLDLCCALGALKSDPPKKERCGVLVVARYMSAEEWDAYCEGLKKKEPPND